MRVIAGVREHHAAEDPEHRCHDEQRDEAGVARDFDDYVSQGKGPQLQYSMRLSVKTSARDLQQPTQLLY